MNDRCERAYFYRGMLYKRLGNQHAGGAGTSARPSS